MTSFLSSCAPHQSLPPDPAIWSPTEKRHISESEALQRLAAADFVLLGESHDNPDHHRLQARAIAKLAALGQKRALVFEMIESDKQPLIDDLLAKPLAPSALELGRAVGWASSGWPDFELYAPVFQAGLDAVWPIIAGNLPKQKHRAAGRPGGLSLGEERRLGLDRPLPSEIESALRRDLAESHCGLLPESALPAMLRMQTAWDGAMAQSLLESKARDGALLIAGAEHARNDRAVPYHLARLAPGAKVLSLAFREADVPAPLENTDPLPFDLVWFTPSRPQPDHCADLKKRLGEKKKP